MEDPRSTESSWPTTSPVAARRASVWLAIPIVIAAFAPCIFAGAQLPTASSARTPFRLSSPDLVANGRITEKHIYNGFGCSGQNSSPQLVWAGVPAGTKSLAVTVYDPDAPTGSGWWHWVVYDIPPSVRALPARAAQGAMPRGAVQGMTDFGTKGYGGPCPPVGDPPHRYVFTLYALKVAHLDVPATATAAFVGFNIHANMIAKTSFTVPFGR